MPKAKKPRARRPATFKGKSTKPGGGGAFQMMVDAMEHKRGMNPNRAKAIAASVGRKKYGKAAFQKMAAAGRKRSARRKGK